MAVVSFGFRHGIPPEADMVVDVRFLPNPFWKPDLRPLNGRDAAVRDYVMGQDGAEEWGKARLLDVLRQLGVPRLLVPGVGALFGIGSLPSSAGLMANQARRTRRKEPSATT